MQIEQLSPSSSSTPWTCSKPNEVHQISSPLRARLSWCNWLLRLLLLLSSGSGVKQTFIFRAAALRLAVWVSVSRRGLRAENNDSYNPIC